jgi:hypothetical protein
MGDEFKLQLKMLLHLFLRVRIYISRGRRFAPVRH